MPRLTVTSGHLIQAVGVSSIRTYELETIETIIEDVRPLQLFMILKDSKHLSEIIELVQVSKSKINQVFKVALNQTIRLTEPSTIVQYMVYYPDTQMFWFSNTQRLSVSTDHYRLAQQIYVTQQASQEIRKMYEAVYALTEENKRLFNKEGIKE